MQTENELIEPPHRPHWAKRIVGGLFGIAVIAAICLWMDSDAGQKIGDEHSLFFSRIEPFVTRHFILAPLAYIGVYQVVAILALPVWPLQVLAGMSFGLYEGSFVSLVASTIGSIATVAISRWIAADWFHDRIERRVQQVKKLDETLGHNGLLVVMAIRLTHVLPLGLCNYALGLTRVSYRDVLFGSFLGGIPAIAVYVGIGAHYRPLRNWKFDAAVGAINIVLLLPLILRYLRPDWFKKIGVE
jgi:uncharacterized membrane protein YdjX (TVP38/TMEM64 family)